MMVESAGDAYGPLITEQLTQERARKGSLEQRSLAVITTSGGLVALVFALPALATKAQPTYVLPPNAGGLIVVALVLFIVAAILALAANLPRGYHEVDETDLAHMVTEEWWDDSDKAGAERQASAARVAIITSAREISDQKAFILSIAVGAEVLAVISLAAAVGIIFSRAPVG